MVTQEELEKMSPEEISQLQKDNCIFCKIVRGEIPSKKVYEDSDVLAILDINPAKKGHVLVMPKEHFPIMPLIPPDKFEKLFSATSLIAHGIRKAMLVKETTIFIANGAVAGQQSPHFLFHIFPRDDSDILTNFNLKENPAIIEEQKALEPSLKNNLNIMLSKLVPASTPDAPSLESQPTSSQSPPSLDMEAKKQDLIAQIIEEHDDVRQAIMDDPDVFKQQLKGNPQLEQLFDGVDLHTLSEKLKSSFPVSDSSSSSDESADSSSSVNDSSDEVPNIKESSQVPPSPNVKPVVFLGEDPVAQRTAIFDYFDSKPKAKELLIENPTYFKELLNSRADIKDLFADVNIDLLSVKLKERGEESNDV